MATPYFLIDFENVQPKALGRLKPGAARIKVFLGQHQTRLMLELVQALQPFGNDAEYIQITGSGPDAVDFHIAFHIGRLSLSDPGASFNIISKDRGFDPLVKHLAAMGIGCRRLAEIPDMAGGGAVPPVAAPAKAKPARQPAAKAKAAKPAPPAAAAPAATQARKPRAPAKAAAAATPDLKAHAATVLDWLARSSQPARLGTLRSSIKARAKPALDDKAADAVIEYLRAQGKLSVTGTKVVYRL